MTAPLHVCLNYCQTCKAEVERREQERAEIIAMLECHPGMLLAELRQVVDRAERTPTADDYRQMEQQRDALRAALEGEHRCDGHGPCRACDALGYT